MGIKMSGQGGRVCPRCGTPTSGVSRWCSGCGRNLELVGQLPTSEEHEAKEREQRWLADHATEQARSAASDPQSPPAQRHAEVPPESAVYGIYVECSISRLYTAAIRTATELGYSITNSDDSTTTLSFRTGMSMKSW